METCSSYVLERIQLECLLFKLTDEIFSRILFDRIACAVNVRISFVVLSPSNCTESEISENLLETFLYIVNISIFNIINVSYFRGNSKWNTLYVNLK